MHGDKQVLWSIFILMLLHFTWRRNDKLAFDDVLPELFDGDASDHCHVHLLEPLPDWHPHSLVRSHVEVHVEEVFVPVRGPQGLSPPVNGSISGRSEILNESKKTHLRKGSKEGRKPANL